MTKQSLGRKEGAAAPERLPSNSVIFLVGVFGGIAPTLLRFAIDLSQQRTTITALNLSVLVGIALFGLLGGGVAAIWQEVDLRKVFYIGLGLPSLLTVVSSTATAPRSTVSLNRGLQTVLRPVASAGTDKLKVILPPEIGYTGARAFFRAGPSDQGPYILSTLDAEGEVSVPDRAVEVQIRTPLADSGLLTLSPETGGNIMIVMEFTASRNLWSGFLYAIGAHTKPYSLKLRTSRTTTLPKPERFPA